MPGLLRGIARTAVVAGTASAVSGRVQRRQAEKFADRDAAIYADRHPDAVDGVMKKCTLCVDRLYNTHLEPDDRQPACVRACPTGARHFGDLGDPSSAVSKLVKERGGDDLMPEFGFKPVNKYLPPRPRRDATTAKPAHSTESVPPAGNSTIERLFAWADKALSRVTPPRRGEEVDYSGKLEG